MTKPSERQERFIAEYLKNGRNASAAYRVAYNTSRMKEKSVNDAASKLTRVPHVAQRLEEARKELQQQQFFSVVDVMREWVDIATADPNALMRTRRYGCRHCHGVKGLFQWRSSREYAEALARAMDANAAEERRRTKTPTKHPLPSDEGGYGYNENNPPNPQCKECAGEGLVDTWVADTNKLTGKERKLFAGVKQGKYGIEILTRDQDGALNNIAKAMGMLVDKFKPVDPAANTDMPALPVDPQEAARVYQAFVKGDHTK